MGVAGLDRLLPPLLDVSVEVEVGEEDDEGDGVADERVVHPFGEVTVDIDGMDSVDYC